nr:FlgO family outer membrane protein [Lacimicrobium sp. SS2-24]
MLCLTLLACSSSPPVPPVDELGNIEWHTYELAEELFENFEAKYAAGHNYSYAVATFVPVATLKYQPEQQHPLMLLGHQLEQGMISEASRRGYIPQDFKVTNDIIIETQADRVLSRNVDDLAATQRVDFYISGTIVEQASGAIVNARIIQVDNKAVVAAATKFFPDNLFWREQKVTTRNGMLYRQDALE